MSRRPPRSRSSPISAPAVVAALLWLGVVALLYGYVTWPLYGLWLIGGTVATALLFAFDKGASKGAGRRVPEKLLLTLVLLGGVLGGWVGMLLLRHKTRHTSFWAVQWLASALHAVLAWWLLRV